MSEFGEISWAFDVLPGRIIGWESRTILKVCGAVRPDAGTNRGTVRPGVKSTILTGFVSAGRSEMCRFDLATLCPRDFVLPDLVLCTLDGATAYVLSVVGNVTWLASISIRDGGRWDPLVLLGRYSPDICHTLAFDSTTAVPCSVVYIVSALSFGGVGSVDRLQLPVPATALVTCCLRPSGIMDQGWLLADLWDIVGDYAAAAGDAMPSPFDLDRLWRFWPWPRPFVRSLPSGGLLFVGSEEVALGSLCAVMCTASTGARGRVQTDFVSRPRAAFTAAALDELGHCVYVSDRAPALCRISLPEHLFTPCPKYLP